MGKQRTNTPNQGPRRTYNNNNPHNKLNLNKFHQIGAKAHTTQSNQLHKKKRDLQRLIQFKKSKNQEVDAKKIEHLQKINEQLSGKKKVYQKNMRKQFFIKNKYKQIMEIEMRKVMKKIRSLEEQPKTEQNKKQLAQWEKKQRYIKYYPKNLKYVSLFPSTKPLEDAAIQFQQKIMNDIQQTYLKKLRQKNEYISENKNAEKNKKIGNVIKAKDGKKDDNFFIVEAEEEQIQD